MGARGPLVFFSGTLTFFVGAFGFAGLFSVVPVVDVPVRVRTMVTVATRDEVMSR